MSQLEEISLQQMIADSITSYYYDEETSHAAIYPSEILESCCEVMAYFLSFDLSVKSRDVVEKVDISFSHKLSEFRKENRVNGPRSPFDPYIPRD